MCGECGVASLPSSFVMLKLYAPLRPSGNFFYDAALIDRSTRPVFVVSDEGLEVGSEKAVQEGYWTAGSRMGKKRVERLKKK